MRQFKILGTAFAVALLVAACGGGGDGDQTPPVKYTNVVSFGDSLSDAGTYDVGPIAAAGGGKFTVNGIAGAPGAASTPSYTWAQLVSASVTGTAGCAARMGGFGVAETAVANCFNYAQGGARVSNANGIGNAEGGGGGVGALPPLAVGATRAGALTEPLTTQVSNYLADINNGQKFTGNELVTVLAGPNDLFAVLDQLTQDATAAGGLAGATAFVTSVVTALAPHTANPATGATAIQNAMIAAQTAAAGLPGATTTSILTAGGNAAVAAAAAVGNTDVMNMTYINSVMGPAQAAATTAGGNALATSLVTQLTAGLGANAATAAPAIGAAFQLEAAKPTATPTSLITAAATAAGIDAATHGYTNANLTNIATIGATAGAAANTAGGTAFVSAVVTALAPHTANPATGATAIQNAMVAAQTAAATAPGATTTSILTAGGNAAVQAAAGAGNTDVLAMTYINSVMGAAQVAATTAGTNAGNTYAGTTGAANAQAAVIQAADDLATAVNAMVAAGAKRVVVLNLPDMSLTPSAQSQAASTQQLVKGLTQAFNAELQAKLGVTTLGVPANGILMVDFFTNMQNNVNDPTHYALVAGTTISPTSNKPMALLTPVCGSSTSLTCNLSNITIPTTGSTDVVHFMFADSVHPTPYGHKLLSQVVNKIMIQAGWL